MFIPKPHEVQAPQVDPLSSRVRASRVLVWILVIVGLGAAGTGGWWYVTNVYLPDHPRNNNLNVSQARNVNTAVATTIQRSAKDSDGDGLEDDVEILYGTDAGKNDTDGDGYTDGDEVKNGYSPLLKQKGARMIDGSLVETISKSVATPIVVSSGIGASDRYRYYLVFDGASTAYFAEDGTLAVQCKVGDTTTGKCATLPNEIRTDYSRTFADNQAADAFHIPY